jgi:hypothetical protein
VNRVVALASVVAAAIIGVSLIMTFTGGGGREPFVLIDHQRETADPLAEAEFGDSHERSLSSWEGGGSTPASGSSLRVAQAGQSSIRGRVVGPANVPISGAKLQCFVFLESRGMWSESAEWGGHSIDSGHFSIQGLPASRVRLQVTHQEYAQSIVEFQWAAREDLHLPDVVLTEGVSLRGVVRAAGGASIEGARIFLVRSVRGFGPESSGGKRDLLVATTAVDGRFQASAIAAGAWAVRAEAEGYAPQLRYGSTALDDVGDEIAFSLYPNASLAGRVVNHEGAGLPGVDVIARLVSPTLESSALPKGTPRNGLARTDSQGHFLIEGLVSESSKTTYQVQARLAGRGVIPVTQWIEVLVGSSDLLLVQPLPCYLRARFTSRTTGSPVVPNDLRLVLEPEHGGRTMLNLTDRRLVMALESGEVVLGPLLVMSESRATLYVTHEGHDDLTSVVPQVSPGMTSNLGSIALDPLGVVEVLVVDDRTGRSLSNVRVSAQEREFSEGRPVPSLAKASVSRTDVDGIARVALSAGSPYLIKAELEGYAPSRPVAIMARLDGPALRIRLSRGGVIHVEVRDGTGQLVAGQRIELVKSSERDAKTHESRSFNSTRYGVTGETGKATLDGVGEGVHLIRTCDDTWIDGQWTEVLVEAGGEVHVQLRVPQLSPLMGTVYLGSDPLASAWIAAIQLPVSDDLNFNLLRQSAALRETNVAGRFRLGALPCTEFRLVAFSNALAAPHRVEIRHSAEERDIVIRIEAIQITGQLLDEDWQPLRGALVGIAHADQVSTMQRYLRNSVVHHVGAPSGQSGLPIAVDAEGRFRLSVGHVAEQLYLLAYAPGKCVRILPVTPRAGVDVGVVILPTGGAVLMENGIQRTADEWLRLELVPLEGTAGPRLTIEPFHGGPLRIKELMPGSWRAELWARTAMRNEQLITASPFNKVVSGEVVEILFQ